MNTEPTFIDVAVDGGTLNVARWGSGPNTVLAVHGITASSISWLPVVRRLPDDWTVLAPDLRGRGASAGLGGPYGMAQHAEDLVAVARQIGFDRAVVAGQSMGGYVAVELASRHPELVERIVLVDGGLPLPISLDGVDPDTALEATLGPALQRLQMGFTSLDAYFDFWRQHPALANDWSEDLEAYLRYDLTGDAPDLRSRTSDAAVRADGRALLVDGEAISEALTSVRCPIHLIRAPRGLLDEPPGVQPTELVDAWKRTLPSLTDELVDETNHYTVAFGATGAQAVADRIAQHPVEGKRRAARV